MKSRAGIFIAAVILAVTAYLVLARGGVARIHFIPAAMAVIIVFCAWLILLNHQRNDFRADPLPDLLLLAFLGWTGLTYFSSVNREQTLFALLGMAVPVMAYFLAARAACDSTGKRVLLVGIFAVAVMDAVYGLSEYISGRPLFRLDWVELPSSAELVRGTYGNHNHFAGLMEMAAPLGLGLVASSWRRREALAEQASRAAMAAIPSAVLVLAAVLSLSRGGWASMAAGLFVFVLLLWWNERPRAARVALTAILIVVVAASVLAGINRKPLYERLETLENIYARSEDISLKGRLSVWRSTVSMIEDKPLTGTGLGVYRNAYPSYREPGLMKAVTFAHNDFLHLAATAGVPALVLFLAWIAAVFRAGLRALASGGEDFLSSMMPAVLAAMFALLVHGLVDFNLMIPANRMIFFILAGVAVSAAGRSG